MKNLGYGLCFTQKRLDHTRVFIKSSISGYATVVSLRNCATAEALHSTINNICGVQTTHERIVGFGMKGYKHDIRVPEGKKEGFKFIKDCILGWHAWYEGPEKLERMHKKCDVWLDLEIEQK